MAREPFQYAVVRIVPRVERGEFINAGVILFCRTRGFLEARIRLDEHRLAALDTDHPLDVLREHLKAVVDVAAGNEDAGAIGHLPQSERFHWLVSPSSTVIQTSPVHSGLCEEPGETLERLVQELVAAPAPVGWREASATASSPTARAPDSATPRRQHSS